MENKILAKIQKLLALATSPNENEAKLAAAKAEELLVLHNLDMQQVQGAVLDYEKLDVHEGARRSAEDKFVCGILMTHFFVQTITRRKIVRDGWTTTRKTVLMMVGEKTNVQVAAYVYSFLVRKFQQCFTEYRQQTGAPASARASYYMGLYQGLMTQLEEAKRRVQDEQGLVLVKDPNLGKAVKDLVGATVTQSNAKVNLSDVGALQAGRETGKNLTIARGLGGPSVDSGKYLG